MKKDNMKFFQEQVNNLYYVYLEKLSKNKFDKIVKIKQDKSIVSLDDVLKDIKDKHESYTYDYRELLYHSWITSYFLKQNLYSNLLQWLKIFNSSNLLFKDWDSNFFAKTYKFSLGDFLNEIFTVWVLYSKNKEVFLTFFEKYVLVFCTIKAIFDENVLWKKRENDLKYQQCKNILQIVEWELEKRIWWEHLKYCYQQIQSIYCKGCEENWNNQLIQEAFKNISESQEFFHNQRNTSVELFKQLEKRNETLGTKNWKYLEENSIVWKIKESLDIFSYINNGNHFELKKYIHWNSNESNIFSFYSLIDVDIKKIKEQVEWYIQNLLDIYWESFSKVIKEQLISKYFEWKIDLRSYRLSYEKDFSRFESINFHFDEWFVNEEYNEYINKETWLVYEKKKNDFFDRIFMNNDIKYLKNFDSSLLDFFSRTYPKVLSKQYALIKILRYVVDWKNTWHPLWVILYSYLKEFLKMESVNSIIRLFNYENTVYNIYLYYKDKYLFLDQKNKEKIDKIYKTIFDNQFEIINLFVRLKLQMK